MVNSIPDERYISAERLLWDMIAVREERTLITEGVQAVIGKDTKGGVITFSTDVNALKISDSDIVDKIGKFVLSFKNRMTYANKAIALDNNITGWTVGKFLDGMYRAKNGKTFSEKSYSVEVVGIPSDKLIAFAEGICREFCQESVLVKDYNTGDILLVDSSE